MSWCWTPAPALVLDLEPASPISAEVEMPFTPFPHGLVELHWCMFHDGFASRSTGETHEDEDGEEEAKLGDAEAFLKNDLDT